MNYIAIKREDMANGPGVRVSLWISGCTLGCEGCHNPSFHDFTAGMPFTEENMNDLREWLNRPEIRGLTLTGGHPLEKPNIKEVLNIVKTIRKEFPNKDIWLYTGLELTYEDFIMNNEIKEIISNCDVIVDGRFKIEERDITLPYRGSRNQRLIDVKKTIENKKIILLTL